MNSLRYYFLGVVVMFGCKIHGTDGQLTIEEVCVQQFCSLPPDESAYVQGPYYNNQTYLLFSGPCVLPYSLDFANNKLNVSVRPTAIPSFLKLSVSFSGVTLAYESFFANLSGSFSNQLNLVNRDGALLICSVDDTTASVIKCSSAVKPAGGIVQLAKASSASSLYHALQPNGVGPAAFVFYNYGVLPPANVELGLFSSDFSTLFSQSTGFLSKQNTIKKITALQFVRNLASKSSYQLMAVFGTDAKGLANLGYVGYTEQYTSYNFNRSAPFTTFTWISEPKPLKSQFEGALTCP